MLLKQNSIKKEINYKDVLQRLSTIENNEFKDIIILDVQRTPFETNEEVRRNVYNYKISKLLISFKLLQ